MWRIKWTNKLTGFSGQSKNTYQDLCEAQKLADELNADYPNMKHEVVPVLAEKQESA